MKQLTVSACLIIWVIGTAVLGGCGAAGTAPWAASPAGTKGTKSRRPATQQMMPSTGLAARNLAPGQAPGVAIPGATAGPDVATMVGRLHQVQQQTPGFIATVETFDKGPKGQSTDTMRVAYKKPSTLRIEMIKSEGQAQGAKILWTGGGDLRIKPTFLPMAMTLGITDEKIKSKNGWTIKDTEVNAIFRVVFAAGVQIKVVGQEPLNGKTLTMYEVRSPASPKGVSHEVVGIDPQTGLPAMRLLFKAQDLLYKLTIKQLQIKQPSQTELEI